MRRIQSALLGAIALLVAIAPSSYSQSNLIPGTDISLGGLSSIGYQGRIGAAFPNGMSAFAMGTTSCNTGAVPIPFNSAMQEQHPFISFMMVRQDDERMVQISDRSFMKHAWAAVCGSYCSSCNCGGGGLGPGCSDPYGVGTNASRFWLGPADELDPYLGEWTAFGSFFDGTPADGNRSYQGNEPNAVNHRVQVLDADLNVPGADFHYQAMYTVRGEQENTRADNLGWLDFNPVWTGSAWSPNGAGGTTNPNMGSVLNAWDGAALSMANNGTDDGRVHVAYKATVGAGSYHYEYALHNQDNNRGIGRFEVPIDPNVTAFNFGFHDIDEDASNDWTATQVGGTIIFETTTNPLRWNTIYNFWFDADAAPATAMVSLEQFSGGPGLNEITASALSPLGDAVEVFCFGDGGATIPGCTPCPCGNNAAAGFPGGCVNSAGGSAVLRKFGTPSVANDTLSLDMIVGNPNTFAILASGNNNLPVASGTCPPGTGIVSPMLDGLRCVGGALLRHGTRATDGLGNTTNGWGPPAGPIGGIIASSGFTAGQTRYFQAFYREFATAGCGTGQNTTNGLKVSFVP